jgi:hypothetical protein
MRFLFIIFAFSPTLLFSQVDTLYKTNSEKLGVNVTEINESNIKYTYPDEFLSNTIAKVTVLKIHFKSGRIQEFSSNSSLVKIKSCLDWKKIQVSKIESEVKGLRKVSLIGAKAKGSVYTSTSKLQDRAFNKIKIITAMLGGNIVYVLNQNTESASVSGQFGGTVKAPSVTISGSVYTSQTISESDISSGEYNISKVYVLKPNAYSLSPYNFRNQEVKIVKEEIVEENGFQNLNIDISSLTQVSKYNIIYADEEEIVLSGVSATKRGKTTYYNVFLTKK